MDPKVSIATPVFNNEKDLPNLFRSLIETHNDTAWELILVDNASTDQSPVIYQQFAEQFSGVTIVRNDENRNFAGGTNQAIALAKGPYVLCLNSDIVCLEDHWLDKMVATLESDEKIAGVGAKLLFTSGLIQHAGVVFSRGLPYHADRGKPKDEPRTFVRRDFPVLTAACLLLKKSVLNELGAFDEHFKNGYEDVDLCLRIVEAGYRLTYEPDAVLTHAESQSSGRHNFEGENIQYLIAKWGGVQGLDKYNCANEYYNGHPSMPSTECWQQKSGVSKGKILCFLADHTGCGHYRMRNPYRGMVAAGWDVMFTTYAARDFIDWADIIVLQRQSADHMWEKLMYAKALGKKVIYEVDDYFHGLDPSNPVLQGFLSNPQWLRNMERFIYHCDALTVSTDDLARHYGRFNKNTHVVDNYVDLSAIPQPIKLNDTGKIRIGWGGSYTHDEDMKILREPITRIINEFPDTVLVFLGTDYRHFFPEIPVERMEWLAGTYDHEEGVHDYYKVLNEARLDIGVAPLMDTTFTRSKSSIKLIEYGAFGIAVVASDAGPYHNLLDKQPWGLLARSPNDWYRHLKRLIEHPDELVTMARNLQQYVWGNRHVVNMTAQVEQICLDLLSGNGHKAIHLEPVHSLNISYYPQQPTAKKAEEYFSKFLEQQGQPSSLTARQQLIL